MAGIRKSARIITVRAKCGHSVMIQLPPGELGQKGNEYINKASTSACFACKEKNG